MKRRIFLPLLIILVLLVAFLLRSKMILSGDFYFLSDQARDLLLVRDIVVNKKLTLIGARTGLGGLFHGPLWIYMLVPWFLLTNGNPLYISYFFIVVSLTIVLSGYYAGYRLFGRSGGLLLSLFLAGSSTLYKTVPYTTNAQVMPLVLVFYLFFLLLFIRHKEISYFLITIFICGVGFQFEAAFSIFLLPFLFLTAIFINRQVFQFKKLLLAILIFIIPLSSRILFDLRHNFLMTRSIINLLAHPEELKPIKGYERYSSIVFRIRDRLISLIESFKTTLPSQNQSLYLFFFLILIFGLLIFIKDWLRKRQDKEYLMLLILPLFIYTLYILYPFPIWSHYTMAMSVIVAFLLLLSIRKVWSFLLGKALIFFFISFYIYALFYIIFTQRLEPYRPTSDGSYVNQLRVVDDIFRDAGEKKFSYFVYNPQVFTYAMDYLMWYRGRRYGFFPSNRKSKGLMYLIMYPNDVDKSAHNYWIKNVIRTNAVLLDKKIYKGRIIVEKRLIAEEKEAVDPNYYLPIR